MLAAIILSVVVPAPRIARVGSTVAVADAQVVRAEALGPAPGPVLVEAGGVATIASADWSHVLGQADAWSVHVTLPPGGGACVFTDGTWPVGSGVCRLTLAPGRAWIVRAWFCGGERLEEIVVDLSCPADRDGDGGVTVDDQLAYARAYEAGDAMADVDDGTGAGRPDGGVDINDLLYFLAHYETGC